MIASEASLESFPGSREESHKRSQSDGDEDQERNHVKKRRKQSKPIRITAVDSISDARTSNGSSGQENHGFRFSETGEHFLTERLDLTSSSPTEQYNELVQEPNEVYSDNQGKRAQPENIYGSTVPLNLSSIKSSFIDNLFIPNVEENQINNHSSIPVDNSVSTFRTSESPKLSIAQEASYLSHSPSLILPMFKQNQMQGQISHISPQMRIFNPEAFCDLCNKEFCNKYFLKTHKANKHGIYSENQNGAALLDPMSSLPFTNYFSTPTETYDSQPNFQTASSAKNLTQYNQANYPSSRNTPKKSQILQQPQSSLFSLKSNSGGNTRALCNICQREFCNKYFVRRHKLKIHGIVEPVSKDGSSFDFQENSAINNNSSQDKLDVPSCDTDIFSGYLKQFIPSNFNVDPRDTSHNLDIKSENSKETPEQVTDCEIQATQLSHNVQATLENSSGFQITQQEENDKENSISSGKLKKIGVVNADAFCDICCKEYCNKYFLRTHKLKSHGILPADERKEDFINGTSNMSWYQTQTTPLNLIVNETPSTNRESNNKLCFDIEGEECVCNTCGRYFQSQYLLKMHQAYSHPNKFVNDENSLPSKLNPRIVDATNTKDVIDYDKSIKQIPETYKSVVKSEYAKDFSVDEIKEKVNTENSENLKKLQTLISRFNNSTTSESPICDVCEKNVGHISLLENHILKEHAVLLEELGNIAEDDSSSSQAVSSYPLKKECPHCQKIFFKTSLLEKHITEAHSHNGYSSNLENIKESSEFKDNNFKMSPLSFAMQSSEDRQGLQTPTSSFCEICKKELCNKYFMKTHMQRMHGISIENGAQIGGVVCDICNKELCSKYFLRVHKQNSHGIVDELFLPQLGFDFGRNQSPNTDSALKPTDQSDLTHRYFTHFNEVCGLCNRRFRSIKWLKAHLWNDHGEEGKEKWKDVYLQYNSESKANCYEENMKGVSKSVEFPIMFDSPSNQLSQITSTVEEDISGKEDLTSGDKSSLVEKGSLNNTSTTFSMLMNGKDSGMKHYQCSYCSFTTTILAFLFIHERSHISSGYQLTTDQPSQCPICFQNINSKAHLEKHFKMHNIPWQQPYSINNTNQDVSKLPENKLDMKNEPIICKTSDTIGASYSDPVTIENMTVKSLQGVKAHVSQKDQSDVPSESTLQCTRCTFSSSNVKIYLDHLNKEHPYLQMDQELPSYLQQMEKALSTMACNAGIPAVFAVPQVKDTVTMQPFVLEDSENGSGLNNAIDAKPGKTFLSSLVFLPVKKKLKKSVTASFKLTPT